MYCVYKHTCPNGKVYIGITSNYARRCVPGNYRHNIRWTRAINKYGWDAIKHEILFENLTKEEACQKEIELIDLYNSLDPNFGYNINLGGNIPFSYGKHLSETHKRNLSIANTGKTHTDETKEKLRQAKLGKALSEEHKRKISEAHAGKHTGANNCMYGKDPWNKGKKIVLTKEQFERASRAHTKTMTLYQYDLDYNLINTFTTYKEAAEATGIPVRRITNNACGHQKSAYGFIFTKEKFIMKQLTNRSKEFITPAGSTIYVLLQRFKGLTTLPEYIKIMFTCIFKDISNDGKITIISFDNEEAALKYFNSLTDDNVVEYMTAAKKDLVLVHSDLSATDKARSAQVVCLETGYCYASAREAERHTGVSHSSIVRACKGVRKTAGELHWEFYSKI